MNSGNAHLIRLLFHYRKGAFVRYARMVAYGRMVLYQGTCERFDLRRIAVFVTLIVYVRTMHATLHSIKDVVLCGSDLEHLAKHKS